MNQHEKDDASNVPVYVIESIPVQGQHRVSKEERLREAIPTPTHLRLAPELGRGTMGHVHPALDRNLLRHVALKRLDKKHVPVPMYRDGFIAEAQMTGQLEHPNIVPVHELAIGENGVPYFTMKLVQGIDLKAWFADPKRPPGSSERLEQGLDIMLKICDAIAYAHHRGVIHRDLKPENIMVGEFGQVYVMDWGLARLVKTKPASGERAQMEAQGPVGTLMYMAPEQARGVPADMDERSDVFGLGALLYELVSGQWVYGKARTFKDAVSRATEGRVIALEEAAFGIHVPARLRDIVMKAVAPAPADRFQSVLALQEAIREFVRGGLHLPSLTFRPGERIVREGDVGDAAYMIVAGTCRAFRDVDGSQETLTTMQPGDVFGEMALLLDEPRAASVEAINSATVLVLDKRTVDEGIGAGGWTGAMVRGMAQRFRKLEQQVRDSGMRRQRK